ncbi:Signal transduction histidine kinase CheA [Brevinematales bacterium NS]|nr:chemotaxis protein CheA [Brevinematales bacterium]QJR20998.1 Signal transduction histidine kinase CheA [Brevinematales bacterium NS]
MPYDPEMKEIIDAFVSEGYERLEEAENQLPHIQEAYHEQIVQTLFRLFHSLKGSAGYLNFENIKNLTHEAESLLDIFRKTGIKPSAEDVDLIYKAMDFLRQLLDNVAANLTDEGFEGEVNLMIEEISQASTKHLKKMAELENSPPPSPPETASSPEPLQKESSLSSEEETASSPPSLEEVTPQSEEIPTEENTFAFIEEEIPIAEEIPVEEDIEEEASLEETLLSPSEVLSEKSSEETSFVPQPETPPPSPEAPVSGSENEEEISSPSSEETPVPSPLIEEEVVALSEGFEEAPLQEPTSQEAFNESPLAESSPPQKEEQVSPPPSPPAKAEEEKAPPQEIDFSRVRLDNLITPEMVERFRSETTELLDEAEQHVLSLENAENKTDLIQAIFRSIHTIKGNASFLTFERIARQAETLENILDSLRNNSMPFTPAVTNILLRGIDYIRRDLSSLGKEEKETEKTYKPLGEILVEMGAADRETVEEALLEKEKPIGEILIEKGVVSEEEVNQALKKQAGMTDTSPLGLQKREIRVDASRLDRLFDLMGELINAEAMVLHHPMVKNIQDDNLQKAISHLTKISRELQEVTMEVRMVPLEGLFMRMHRLVRDLSRKFDKSIELRIIGQENEIDKNLIDQIADPLVHLLRNAIDHGIESPEERRQKGKPERGLVELSAQYQGNEIWISVRDDGRGLSREKILAKAQAKGLLHKSPEDMTDNEVWKLIFLPGFSTKDEVTDISGRGVGMDVVIKNIEKLRGQVDILTYPNEGTTITMKIPLTMAILDGVVCRIGQALFIIPLADIVEFFKPQQSQITRGEANSLLINLRGEILPVLDLEDVFYHQPNPTPLPQRILIVVSSQERKMTIAVDEIISSQQVVVKSLSDFIGRIEGMIGCSILNEGQIGFIVDVKGLSRRMFE